MVTGMPSMAGLLSRWAGCPVHAVSYSLPGWGRSLVQAAGPSCISGADAPSGPGPLDARGTACRRPDGRDHRQLLHPARLERGRLERSAAMRNRMMPHLSAVPGDGTNTVLVGHDDPFDAATGICPEPMGVTFVLRPLGDGFEVLGGIGPDVWPE